MVKKSPPLLEETEIEQLVKDANKRVIKRPVKKPIEKDELVEPIKEKAKPKPKPISKETKKEQEKIVKAIKIFEPKKVNTPIKIEPSQELELVLRTVTRYDINWFYLKTKLVKFKKWVFSPYTKYVNWFNKKFNNVNYEKLGIVDHFVTIDELYENIPEIEKQIHKQVNEKIHERFRGKIND